MDYVAVCIGEKPEYVFARFRRVFRKRGGGGNGGSRYGSQCNLIITARDGFLEVNRLDYLRRDGNGNPEGLLPELKQPAYCFLVFGGAKYRKLDGGLTEGGQSRIPVGGSLLGIICDKVGAARPFAVAFAARPAA